MLVNGWVVFSKAQGMLAAHPVIMRVCCLHDVLHAFWAVRMSGHQQESRGQNRAQLC